MDDLSYRGTGATDDGLDQFHDVVDTAVAGVPLGV